MIYWETEIIPNFKLREAKCPHCGLVILQPKLLVILNIVRTEFGEPIGVTSWTRCKRHNAAVGGAKQSYHMNGKAVDLTADELDELAHTAAVYFPYVKRYEHHLHCDIRGERP